MPKISVGPDKPPYRVPLMAEIAKVPWNGFNAISTFSGCGGSSLGYRMAGFKVLWASEFVEAARDSYRTNMSPGTVLDDRDIRQVKPEEILKAIKMQKGQLDLCDASPPCASFSTAGKRQAGWNKVKKYSDTVQRTDDLFFEFVRILRGLMPRTFVAENVSGLVKGTAKGYFLMILKELKESGYRVRCKVLDAQWLGVPQQRQRTIFVGVREDLADAAGESLEPCHPSPLPYRYSVREAIPWICGPIVQQQGAPGIGKKEVSHGRPLPTVCGTQAQQFIVREPRLTHNRVEEVTERSVDNPSPSVRAQRAAHLGLTNVEPESDMTGKATGDEWDNVEIGGQSDKYFQLVKPALNDACPTVTAVGGNAGLASVCHPTERRKFSIAELRRICAFPDDFILTGSYAQQWERLGRAVPPLMMRAVAEVVRDQILRKARR